MTTSLNRLKLSKPSGAERIPKGVFAYLCARHKRALYTAFMREMKKAGINNADLANRLDKDPGLVSRYLAGTANWTADTTCELFFAATGAVLRFEIDYPFGAAVSEQAVEVVPVAPEKSNERPPIIGLGQSALGADLLGSQPTVSGLGKA